ncbi:unnamed protein product [Alternaria alternata]
MHPFASSSSYVPIVAETSPTSDQSSLQRPDGIVPEESGDEGGGEQPNVVEAGFLGQISEVQWLQSLRSRVQAVETVFVGPANAAAQFSQPPSPTFDASPASVPATPLQQIAPTNYYLDNEGIKLTDCGNPFELPPEHTAACLFQCYTQTVQSSFPILPITIEHQLHKYYTLIRNGQAVHCPEKWFALVNLVFAIGAKFSHLIQADWRADDLHSLESLLSSITGRPSIIPNEDITTPLPGVLASDQTQGTGVVNSEFLDADANLNLLTQRIISNLYTQRRSTPSWDYLQQITVSLVGDLDKWAVDQIPELLSQEWNSAPTQQRERFLLKLQYYRLKILCTRPSLHRVERCFEAGTDDFDSLDQSVADACVRAAQDVASLLASEPHMKSLYEKGPWWTIVHNFMQALAVLMIAISCPNYFRDSLPASTHSARQLVSLLRGMRDTNALAARAYQFIYSIVKTSEPFVWADIADAFPDEVIMVLQQPAAVKVDPRYLPWPDNDQPIEALLRYEIDRFGNYNFHTL